MSEPYEDFLSQARQAGEVDSEGTIKTDIESMRRKLASQLHGEEGLWLVCLLQSAIGAARVSLQTQMSRLQIAVTAEEYPTPATFAPYLLENQGGCSPREWSLLKSLLSLPPHLHLVWFGPDGKLSREKDGGWVFQAEEKLAKKSLQRFQVVNLQSRDNWTSTLRACSYRFPLPPYPLFLNKQRCWPELEGGGREKLLLKSGTPGSQLEIFASDTQGKVNSLVRLGLASKPFHRIVYLDRGARIHHQELPLESYFLCTEIFVDGCGLPTDLSGFSLRETRPSQERLEQTKLRVFRELRPILSKLISHPRLPRRFEEQRRQESVVSSAVALGGLSFLQVPFFHPFLTLGLATAVIGGMGIRSVVKKRREPWRGEYGLRRIRRDLVEIRKQIDGELETDLR